MVSANRTVSLGLLNVQYAPKGDSVSYSTKESYRKDWETSIKHPEQFWAHEAEEYHWHKPWESPFCRWNFDTRKGRITSEWFVGALTNVAYNCLDRHIEKGNGDKVAFQYEGNDPDCSETFTYQDVLNRVCQLSNYMRSCGLGKGDDVTIYMSHIPQLLMAMLACARIGAVHSVVFAGYSDEALAQRMMENECKLLITCSAVRRGTMLVNLKAVADRACEICASSGHIVRRVLVYHHDVYAPRTSFVLHGLRDEWWQDVVPVQPKDAEPEWVEAEHILFKLSTSGSTDRPKSLMHSTAGYMVAVGASFKYTFDYRSSDVYFCTADAGWITGTSYVAYGPMLQGASQIIFEGTPLYPDPGRYWAIVQKYKVTTFYTAPTAIRMLLGLGDEYVHKYNLTSLRVLGSVGEPINPEAWHWFYEVIGRSQCPIVDTYWQTETGCHMITALPGCTALKPGCATLPFFGVLPALLDEDGKEMQGEGEGYLVFKQSWPSMARTIAADHVHYENTYFNKFPGYYFSGDSARRDRDGYFWILGRVDDVLNVSGHRLGTAEVEAALTSHAATAECAVVSVAHPIKGEGIYAYVCLKKGYVAGPETEKQLLERVKNAIGPIALPDTIAFVPELPRTRTGKIMRRVLRKIANGQEYNMGDLSSCSNIEVIEVLIHSRRKQL